MTPATRLKSGQKVLVRASGFSPGESLVVTECAAKGAATGPGDCDLNGMQSVTSDASGRVKVDLTVTKGPFGANNIVCGPAQACLISVTQATPSPTREADTPITFGLPGHARRDGDQPTPELARGARESVRLAMSPNDRLQQLFYPWASYQGTGPDQPGQAAPADILISSADSRRTPRYVRTLAGVGSVSVLSWAP